MTLQACDTFPSCLPSSSSPTFALMTFCSVLMSMLLSLLRGIDGPSNCQIKSEDFQFCLSTDATGVAVQPEPLAGRQRQACRKGHFFVVMADADHVFFEYQPKHTSAAVCEMFRGFQGYIQADAHVIYDAIFRGEARASPGDKPPLEVGCWSHCRRRAWEA